MEGEARGQKEKGGGPDTHSRTPSTLFRSISQAFAQNGPTELGVDEIKIGRSSLLSLATYAWLTPLVWQLYRRGVGSILNLAWMEVDTTEYNVKRLERAWNEELKVRGPSDARLGRAIRSAYSRRLICSCITVFITLTFSFVGSAVMLRLVLKQVEEPESPVWKSIMIVCMLVLCEILRSLTFSLAWCFNYWTGMRVREAAMGLLYRKMLRLRSLKDKKIGELVNMCSNDGQRLYEVMANGPFILGGPLVFIAGSVYLVFLMGVWALVGIGTFIVLFIVLKFVADALEHYRMEAVTLTGERVGLMTEVITCMKLIKMNAWEPSFIARIAKKRSEEQSALEKASFLQSIITSLVPMIPVIASVVMFIAYILTGNDLDTAEAFTVIAVLYAISFALALMIHGIRTLADANVACVRYKEVLLMEEVAPFPNEVDNGITVEMSSASFAWEEEELQRVEPTDEDSVIAGITPEDFDPLSSSFSGKHGLSGINSDFNNDGGMYNHDNSDPDKMELKIDLLQHSQDSQGMPQLCNVNVKIKKGELIGICGMKGSGKSSFLAAIMGRLQLLHGEVKVTGRVAYVGQEPWIFNGTARENITFGHSFDSDRFDKIVSACQLNKDFETFGAADLVEIGDRGITLSGGQKQRICLARAMYSNSNVYLLDDPLSALDIQMGRNVFAQCLKIMLKSKTVLLVTHHLEYLPKCDQVMLMHEGRVVEMGPHGELLGSTQGPMYTELFTLYQTKYDKIQRHRLMSCLGSSQDGDVKTPQRGFSRMSLHQLTRHLSRMSTNTGFQHQFSTMSTTSGIYGDYEYVDIDDLVEANELYVTRVPWSVYGDYIRTMGGYGILAFLLISFAISIGIQSATTWFLSYWLNQGDGSWHNTTLSPNSTSNVTLTQLGSVVDHPMVRTFAMVYGLFLVAMLTIMVFRSLVFVKILLKAASNLHQKLLKRIMTCPMKFFDATPLGIILNRFSADIDEIDVRLPSNCELYLQNLFLVVFALVMICYAFPWDLVVVLPLAAGFLVLAVVFAPVIQQLKFVDSITRSPYLSHLATSLEGAATIHTFGQSERFFKQFCEMLDRNNIPFFLFYMANRWLAVFLDLMVIVVIGVTGFLTIFTIADHQSPHAGLALSFAIQITSLLQYTLRLTIETGSRFSSVQRVQEYIENLPTEGAIASSASEVPGDWPSEGAITFNKYCMRYNESLPPAVKGVTLTIKPKEKIGIVGNSGSGKSSLGVGLFRLSEAASGAIYIDNFNIRDIKFSALRSRISILVQDPVLFVGTIRYNLDPPGAHPDDDRLWQVLGKCHMKEKIKSLDGQLDTMVEENGKNFSMGERQLLCLARTLLRNNKILVLDEATASVDTRTDFLVQQTIRECCHDNTVLTIAHRINTIWDCDKVLVMDKGKAIEFNQPHLLLQKSHSKFKDMYDAMKTKPRGESFNSDEAGLPLCTSPGVDDAFS
ncbi:hypothetical protein V1264_010291 [Littorina saxatilis]